MKSVALAYTSHTSKINSSSANAHDYHRSFGFTFVLNAVLCAAVAFLIAYYIVQANGATANTYKVKLLNEQLSLERANNSDLIAQRTNSEDLSALAVFAQARNMIPVTDAVTLSQNEGFALK